MKKKSILSLMLLITICFMCSCSASKKEPDITQVRSICELATVKCYYHNVARSEKSAGTGITHLFEKERKFWIEYNGSINIGIDMAKVKMDINGENVKITLPEAEILGEPDIIDGTLNEDSFTYSDDGFINSNPVTAEEQTKAIADAQQEMVKTASENTALFVQAQERAKKLIENYFKQLGEVTGTTYNITWK